MSKFHYRAKKGPQDIIEGTIDADNPESALDKISQMGYFPVDISEENIVKQKPSSISFRLFEKIKRQDLSILTRQLADLLDSGLTIINALNVVSKQTQNRALKSIVLEIKNFIQEGGSFSEALSRHNNVFSNLYISMVKSGEISGELNLILNRLADFLDSQDETISKVRASLTYPMILAVVGMLTIFCLLSFAVPKLVVMFDELSQTLPLPTKILISVSNIFKNYWWIVASATLAVFIYFRRQVRTKEGKLSFDRMKLKLPVVGDYVKKIEIARFARTLGTLLESGVTIVQSIRSVVQVVDNEALRIDIERMLKDLIEGSSLAKTVSASKYFPEVVINMISVGEEAAQLEKTLHKIADSFEREIDRKIKSLTSLLEPIMLLVIGAVALFIVLAMLLPIFEMNLMVR